MMGSRKSGTESAVAWAEEAGQFAAEGDFAQVAFGGALVNAACVDALIAGGVIGTDEPNAADYQIAPTIRVLRSFADLRPGIEPRPVGELALRLVPRWPEEVPPFLPPEWLAW
jgi:hypothetical protein